MKTIDFETFYKKNLKIIETARDYFDFPEFPDLVRACRLKPLSVLGSEFESSNLVETTWIDEFGNVLILGPHKSYTKNFDFEVDPKQIITTDLFACRSIPEISEMSQWVGLTFQYIVFMGKDKYLRCFDVETQEAISPLSVNMSAMIHLLKWTGEIFKEFDQEEWAFYKLPNMAIQQLVMEEYKEYGKR